MLQAKFRWKQASGFRGDVVWKCEQTPDAGRTDAGRTMDDGRRAITNAHPEHMFRWANNPNYHMKKCIYLSIKHDFSLLYDGFIKKARLKVWKMGTRYCFQLWNSFASWTPVGLWVANWRLMCKLAELNIVFFKLTSYPVPDRFRTSKLN